MMRKINSGFTVIELSVVMGIFLILLTLSFINLTPLPSRATAASSTQNLIADLKAQQTRAMSGDTKGGVAQSDYGVHFEGGSYWLFKGSVFNPSDTTNFKIDLGDVNVSFNTVTVVFEKGSGEVATSGDITITNSLTSEVSTININKYGAATY